VVTVGRLEFSGRSGLYADRGRKHCVVDEGSFPGRALPDDTQLIPVSRTVGQDQIVDEMLFTFTHTREIDWMLPGIPPTGRRVEVPLVAIVRFQDGKVAHEHIYWDQASVLVQIGKLDVKGLPVAGIETARKVTDKTEPSNTLMPRWSTSQGKPL
jgi:carboxymethylenebutenolidase